MRPKIGDIVKIHYKESPSGAIPESIGDTAVVLNVLNKDFIIAATSSIGKPIREIVRSGRWEDGFVFEIINEGR